MNRIALLIGLAIAFGSSTVLAGHSRHSYVDGGQSRDGRYTVTARRVDGEQLTRGPRPFHWEYTWRDHETGREITGRLDGLRSGDSNVFDPVGSHIFVAPDGETFALWTPQVMMQAPTKNPEGNRNDESFRRFEGFTRRLVIYRNTGEVIQRLDLADFLSDADWQWLHVHGRQIYWLTEYPGLTTRSTPRPFYALYRISPDSTVLEFTIGANAEATHKAKQRDITPANPRVVRVRLTDGMVLNAADWPSNPEQIPVQPFVGGLADRGNRQQDYVPPLDPLRTAGRYEPTSE